MDAETIQYIDNQFDKLNTKLNAMLWKFVSITITVLLFFAGSIAYNTKASIENSHEITTLKSQHEKLVYIMTWTAEVSETQRDFFKAMMKNEDVSKFLDKLDDIQKRIDGMGATPSFRGDKMSDLEDNFKNK
jgi:hypothetical protein